jgi:hypothetical protein
VQGAAGAVGSAVPEVAGGVTVHEVACAAAAAATSEDHRNQLLPSMAKIVRLE